ncbi:hypothetical protein ATANTOWER_005942 [Ataeniobius toweri]|uniref:Uncharacterized protein n=1 Tax=Ataeniobius toweri TaxID=208326 RepID=A0ABU7AMS7_9TELE|nr:hypothetical protein [Ataeniobius toweri]
MMKVLKNILYMETEKQRHKSLYVPDKSELEMLCSGTSGDIRSAINSLQFCCLPDRGLFTLKKPPAVQLERTVSLSKQRRKRATSTREQEEHQAIGGKDVSVFLFRALGKILHCKQKSRGESQGNHPAATVQKPQGAATTSPQALPAGVYAGADPTMDPETREPGTYHFPSRGLTEPRGPGPGKQPPRVQVRISHRGNQSPDPGGGPLHSGAETDRPPQLLNLGWASLGCCLNLSDPGSGPSSPTTPPTTTQTHHITATAAIAQGETLSSSALPSLLSRSKCQ